MANTIQIKRKLTTGAPDVSGLQDGEMCLVVPDSKLYQRVNASILILINSGGDLSSIEARLAALENAKIDPIGDLVWEENFDNYADGTTVFSNLTNVGTFNFQVNQGGTSSGGTGASTAYSGLKYIFCESSSPVILSDTAILETAAYDASENVYKLNYAYHAYFDGSVSNVHLEGWNGSNWISLKQYSDSQQTNSTDPFRVDTVDSSGFLNIDFKFRIRLEMISGTVFHNDLCLDKIRLYSV